MIHRGLQRVTRQTSVQCTEAGTEGLKYKAKTQGVLHLIAKLHWKEYQGVLGGWGPMFRNCMLPSL